MWKLPHDIFVSISSIFSLSPSLPQQTNPETSFRRYRFPGFSVARFEHWLCQNNQISIALQVKLAHDIFWRTNLAELSGFACISLSSSLSFCLLLCVCVCHSLSLSPLVVNNWRHSSDWTQLNTTQWVTREQSRTRAPPISQRVETATVQFCVLFIPYWRQLDWGPCSDSAVLDACRSHCFVWGSGCSRWMCAMMWLRSEQRTVSQKSLNRGPHLKTPSRVH